MIFNKFSKYKEIILVDTENVGCVCPFELPKDIFVYIFVNNCNLANKFVFLNEQTNYEVLNINHAKTDGIAFKKNATDFCVVTYAAYLLSKMPKKTKIVILSKDKDYDISIYHIKQLVNNRSIERVGYNLKRYCDEKHSSHNAKEVSEITPFELIEYTEEFFEYKRQLKPAQKKQLRVREYNKSNGKLITIEYDPLHHCYYLVFCGRYIEMANDATALEPQFMKYQELLDKNDCKTTKKKEVKEMVSNKIESIKKSCLINNYYSVDV